MGTHVQMLGARTDDVMNMLRDWQVMIGECNSENFQRCRPVYSRKRWRWMDLSRFTFRICEYDLDGLGSIERKIVVMQPLFNIFDFHIVAGRND